MRALAFLLLLAVTAPGQTISTLIGTGKPGFDATSLNNPYGLVIGPDKALYFCDIDNHAIRRLDLKTKKLTTVAEGLGQPYELRFDKAGNLYFVDMPKHNVGRVDAKTKAVTIIAGTGTAGFSGDGGPASKAEFRQPHSIAFDTDGSLLICDIGNHRVRRLDLKTGLVSTVLGNGERTAIPREGAPVTGTAFNGPRALEVDKDGTLYLVLREGNAVYKVDRKANRVTLVAGTGKKGLTGDGGPAVDATLNGPKGVTMSRDRKLYLADTENHAIRAVDLKTGIISTMAGSGERGDGPDGNPRTCKMNRPHGVFAGADGTLYIADSEAHRIRTLR
ncbi:MAG: SMP-30/gluconolactonase/LRE family protein [Bryobacteraceae bacterium]|nr:SMP-30/gluconolactonase/LRE family protein [Bryobacteraceae bacterium]